ncbi:copper chaperone PCu(A)C [Devosia sp. XJ19-1]|uniref:copper chaperone PCu(A)C n=1 Tax=Devosia ureilytica TaxID=2952754 RepID=UPI0020C77331|nr:copper chaperone PCu(A)C [Devosia ureilytica]MCP8883282.1 copper chaperone PCu(A)C [Devosia ureilytica]
MIRTLIAALTLLALAVPTLAHDITLGTLELKGPFARATLPNAPVAGGFVTIVNTGTEDDRLVSVTADIARETQIHEMAMEGEVMKMRQLADGVVIPAGETVALAPGGYHIMFMGLTQALVEGEKVPVTLTFEKAGTVTIDLDIGATAADAPAPCSEH